MCALLSTNMPGTFLCKSLSRNVPETGNTEKPSAYSKKKNSPGCDNWYKMHPCVHPLMGTSSSSLCFITVPVNTRTKNTSPAGGRSHSSETPGTLSNILLFKTEPTNIYSGVSPKVCSQQVQTVSGSAPVHQTDPLHQHGWDILTTLRGKVKFDVVKFSWHQINV